MRYALIILALSLFSNSQAQLVVDLVDFASNPSRYNGRYIVLRGVFVTKTSGNTITLSGPRTLNPSSPTGALSPSAAPISAGSPTAPITISGPGQIATLNAATTAVQTPTAITTSPTNSRPSPCAPPRNWESLNVEIPNYTGCFMLYSSMARTIPSGRRSNADITIFVDANLMHRIARVKLN